MTKEEALFDAIETSLGRRPMRLAPLHGGMVGEVYGADLADDERVVIKIDRRDEPQLAKEGMMLRYLEEKSDLPVPEVLHCEEALLIMTFLPGMSQFDQAAEEHVAELLVDLHALSAPACGFADDTLIGLLPQPNPWMGDWPTFFAQNRLICLGEIGLQMGRMDRALLRRVEALCERIHEYIESPTQPSLVHGDIWSSNLLAANGRITGVLDPAIYYAHPEVELAYIALFPSFGEAFWRRYQTLRPIEPGFFEQRAHVYQIFPLLSHVCHFGGHYVQSTSDKLALLGF